MLRAAVATDALSRRRHEHTLRGNCNVTPQLLAPVHYARIPRLSKLEGLGSFGDKSRSQVRGFFLIGLSVAARRCEQSRKNDFRLCPAVNAVNTVFTK